MDSVRGGESPMGAGRESRQLVGRGRELERIEAAIADVVGGQGSLLMLVGEAGIGKTTLAGVAGDLAEAAGLTRLSARGGEGESTVPFGVVRQVLEPPLRFDAHLRERVLSGSAELATAVITTQTPSPPPTALPAVDPHVILHGLFWVCSNLAEETPLIIVIDDLHWADPASIRFLSYLAQRASDLPILLLLAFRTSEPVDNAVFDPLLAAPDAATIDLGPLNASETAVVVRAERGFGADDDFCRACHDATGGNPFFLRELGRALRESGVEANADAVEQVAGVTPSAVARTIAVRLRRLPPRAQALAGGLAVLGTAGDLQLAAHVARLEADEANAAADELARADIINADQLLEFRHPIIRTAVYEQLGPGARSMGHEIAAHVLAATGGGEAAAMHLLHVPPAGDPERVRTLVMAGEAAVARGAPEAAVAYLSRALSEPPARGERGAVLFALGRAEAMIATHGSLAHLAEAVELAPRLSDKISVLRETAYAQAANFGLLGEAFETMGAARALARGHDPGLEMLLHAQQQTWRVFNEEIPIADALAELEPIGVGLAGETSAEQAVLALLAGCWMCTGRPMPEVRAAATAALANGDLLATLGSSSLTVAAATWSLTHTLSRVEIESLLPLAIHSARRKARDTGLESARMPRGCWRIRAAGSPMPRRWTARRSTRCSRSTRSASLPRSPTTSTSFAIAVTRIARGVSSRPWATSASCRLSGRGRSSNSAAAA